MTNAKRARFEAMFQFCWQRAHKATSPKARTFWFNQFDCLDGLLHCC